jgi:hypothetical protein
MVENAFAQSIIKGKVIDDTGLPVAYAMVIINGTSEGTTTDPAGTFILRSNLQGKKELKASFVGYETLIYPIVLENTEYLITLILKTSSIKLGEVVINAGSIEANNDRKVAILKPIDIVSTAGGQGDIAGAIQALPGVQHNGGDQTGLMVRGGDVSESMVIIDGTTSQNAFFSNVPGVSQRSRFDPFQFKGTAFSSGGYTIRYGQALSSILDLQTNDLPERSTVNIGLNFSGIALSGSKLMDNNAFEYSGHYNDLTPYYSIAKTNVSFFDIPQGGGFATRWISKVGEKGMFKMNFEQGFTKVGIVIPDPENAGIKINYGLQNENTYFNTSYKHWTSDKLKIFTAFSFSNNTDKIKWGISPANKNDSRVQGRGEVFYEANKKLTFLIGIELQRIGYSQEVDTLSGRFNETLIAGYAETEWKPKRWFGIKAGVRAEYSEILKKGNVVPRISAGIKTGSSSQISLASGVFYQTAPSQYLLQGYKPDFQQAIHYMLNYQWIKNDRTFRIEGYYKSYDQLIRETGVAYDPNQYRFNFGIVDNTGDGYATGVDIFWRDKKSIKNIDYWISYSFINTERLYQNYISKATPDYVSPHNLNLITKYFIEIIQTNISVSYNYASGRGYYNPNAIEFLSDKAPDYHNLALNLSYLTTIRNMFAVIYLSIDNITNQQNILGYRYSNSGSERYPILPPVYRSIFLGINISLSKFNKDEL